MRPVRPERSRRRSPGATTPFSARTSGSCPRPPPARRPCRLRRRPWLALRRYAQAGRLRHFPCCRLSAAAAFGPPSRAGLPPGRGAHRLAPCRRFSARRSCSPPPPPSGVRSPSWTTLADASGAMTEGVVLVERIVAADGATQTNVSAKFMRLSTPADSGPGRAGGRVQARSARAWAPVVRSRPAPGPSAGAATGDARAPRWAPSSSSTSATSPCAPAPRDAARGARLPGRRRSRLGHVLHLARRGQRSARGRDLHARGHGLRLVDRFSVDADAPPALEDVRVADAALADGVALDEGAPATVRWRAPDGARRGAVAATSCSST